MEPAHSPDAILHNGIVLTMNKLQPRAQAIAIEGGRILAVGTSDEILALRDSSTLVVDLQGKTVTPGFIDSHQHRIGNRMGGGYEEPGPIIQLAVEQGWTSLNEMFVHEQRLNELRSLDEVGKLRLRINAYLGLHSPEGDTYGNWYQAYRSRFEYSPFLRLIGVKLFMDHGWGKGELIWTQEEVDQMVLEAHRLNWQIAIHTVGEPAHTMALNALETALGGAADDRYRHRIEHVVVVSDNDIQRMKRLGIIASIQLNGPGTWVDYPDFDPQVTPDMYPHVARWRDLVEAGVFVVGSSDWPWGTLEQGFGSPMLMLYQAVTRTGTNRRPPEAWMLGQALTMEQALRSLTINGAYATFEEDRKGSLESGKLADIVILTENPLASPLEEVPDIQVLMTMIGGIVEYCAVGQESLCPGIRAGTRGPSPVTESPLTAPFTGTWQGTDPFDSSIITLSLVQSETELAGTYKDTFSPGVQPPGYEGSGVGKVLAITTAGMTFELVRWDGNTVQAQYSLTLSDQNNTLTLCCDVGTPIVLQRQ
jgi:predicted amidohydrolase YtcJ